MWFGVAVLVAEATRAAVGSLRGQLPRWHRGMAVGLLALVTLGMAAIAPAWAMGVTPVPVPAFFTSPALDSHVPAGALVYLVPLPTAGAGYDSATWQVVAGMRFRITGGNLVVRGPGGAGERSPGATGPLADAVTSIEAGGAAPSPEDLPALRRALARTGATVVLVGPMPQEAAEIDFMTSLLGRAPHRVGGVALWSIPAPRTTGGPVPH
jgi:hypothetical protein